MTTRQTTLANGLRIVTAHFQDARSLTANIVVGTGSRYEDFADNGGVSHFLEHLLFKGSAKYPSPQAIAEAVDAVGGYNNAYTSEDITSYHIKVPAAHGALALDILCDMVKSPLFDPEEIERERGVIVEEMNVFRDDPARFVGTLIPPLMFPGNSLGADIIGSEDVVRRISPERIAAYQRQHYQPANMVVAVAGLVDHDEVVALIGQSLGTLAPGERDHFSAVGENPAEDLAVVQAKATAQAHFLLAARGYAYGHKDERAAEVLAAILGRGMSSRLFQNVRERQGLAYTVYAETTNYVDTGLFQVYAGVNLQKVDEALTAVLYELEKIRTSEVGEAELRKAQQQLRAGLEMSLESNGSVADRLAAQLILTDKVESIDDAISAIESVTVADVQRVAQAMLAPGALRLAVISPEPEPAAEHFKKLVAQATMPEPALADLPKPAQ